MCGIAGFYHSSIDLGEHKATIDSMLHLIQHRGPDENGSYIEPTVTLGNARLSIIDLLHGQQPMHDATKRYSICYTGEIYNFKALQQQLINLGYPIKTNSDTEVLLYAWIHWGHEALNRFNGSFAFAVYDKATDILTLARDKYGKRPLYYYQNGEELAFASEIKCFLAYHPIQFDFDIEKVATTFASWTPLPDETVFQKIKQVPMGTYMQISGATTSICEYSKLDFKTQAFTGSEEEATQVLFDKLSESVRCRLVGDVEIGTYLSGGLDSAIVTKLAIDHGYSDIRSFSVSFEEKEYDELDKQTLLSEYLGTKHETVRIRNDDIALSFPEAVWHAEVPQFRTAAVPMMLLSRKVREAGIKVVLTGEGSDESFLGYDIFKELLLRQQLNNGVLGEREQAIAARLHPYLAQYQNENYKFLWGMYTQCASDNVTDLFSHDMRFNQSRIALQLLKYPADALSALKQFISGTPAFSQLTATQKAQWLEFKTLLAGYLLSSQGDRMSFANSVENRCPFLDSDVIQFAMSLPENFKLKDGTNEKYLLKRAFKGLLPESILDQPKQPYRAPDAIAFLGHTKLDYLDAVLSESEIQKLDFINLDFYRKFIKKITQSPLDRINPRESQAFIQILSLALLQHFFIKRQPLSSIQTPWRNTA